MYHKGGRYVMSLTWDNFKPFVRIFGAKAWKMPSNYLQLWDKCSSSTLKNYTFQYTSKLTIAYSTSIQILIL